MASEAADRQQSQISVKRSSVLCGKSATASLDRRQIAAPRSSHSALGVLLIDVMEFLLLEVEPHVRAQQETLLVHPHLDGATIPEGEQLTHPAASGHAANDP